jgi:UDP-glucose 4-epimerase
MRILITGATGLTGRSLVALLAKDNEVFAMQRPGREVAPADGVTSIEQDLSGPLVHGLPDQIDAVVHLAQSPRFREFPEGTVDVFEVNSATTVRLLRYCCQAGGTRFVYASSGAVYPPGPRPVREDDSPRPGNFYAVSKLVGEQVVDQFRDVLTVASLRFFFIYGPGQRNMLVPGLMETVRSGRPVPIAGDEGIRINPIYVEDAALAVAGALALEQPGVFNVAGPEVVSIADIARALGTELGAEPEFTHGPAQADLIADTRRMRQHLAVPAVTVSEGIHRLVAADT